ncbi:hypothetical protein V1477_003064 [Vespula maculifrons]|uniref:Uncharacterized protein n=1 Tax=Vespula maculifrons TaxID=7453 RepID=A0ABD2CTG9_VESMC
MLVEVVKCRITVSPRVSRSSNLHAVGPGSAVLVIYRFLSNLQVFLSKWLHISRFFQEHVHRIPTKFQIEINYHSFSRVSPLGWALGRGLLCGSPSFNTEKSCSIFVLWFLHGTPRTRIRVTVIPTLTGVSGAIKSSRGLRFTEPRIFDHAGHANFRVESPLAVGPQMQQPPRGGTWVGSTCNISKSIFKLYLKFITKLYI